MPGVPTTAHLDLPPAALTRCIRAVFRRSTLGSALAPEQRFNHFPASPMCGLTWFLSGSAVALDPTQDPPAMPPVGRPLPPVIFGGPQRGPTLCWNPGEVQSFTLLLMPDALAAMAGVNPEQWVDRIVDAHEVLAPEWHGLLQQVGQAPDDAARLAIVWREFGARWAACHERPAEGLLRYADWARHLALRAAGSRLGRSTRQAERRLKAWAGQPLRGLLGIGRAEQSFLLVRAAHAEGRVDWADVASIAGYADQAHLCRETRRFTGFSPQELRLRIEQDEAFWVYRLWQ